MTYELKVCPFAQKIGYMPEYDALDDNMDAIHQVRYSGELLGMNQSLLCQGPILPWNT